MVKPKSGPTTPSSQRTLETFFSKTVTPKRKGNDENTESSKDESANGALKRTKTDCGDAGDFSVTVSSPGITPDQKKLIMQKQALARLKLLSHNLGVIEPSSIGASWFINILEQEFKKPYFKQLSDFYGTASSRSTVYPPREQIFSWTKHCELRDVKVVILGQDPYHGPRQAHGLCFSVQKGVPAPPSLVNMYKELRDDPGVEEFTEIPSHGYLVGWAEQGVLLLNAVLTVEASKPNSHKDKGWENITSAVIKWISNNLKDVVFLLWGSHAQKMGSMVDKKRHVVLTCTHPSPLSAHRGFFGCRHFSKCNEELEKRGKQKINWAHLP